MAAEAPQAAMNRALKSYRRVQTREDQMKWRRYARLPKGSPEWIARERARKNADKRRRYDRDLKASWDREVIASSLLVDSEELRRNDRVLLEINWTEDRP